MITTVIIIVISNSSSSSSSSSNSSSIRNILYIRMHATHLAQKQGGCLTLSKFEGHIKWTNTGVCTMFSRGSYFLNRLEFLWQTDTVFTLPSEYVTVTII